MNEYHYKYIFGPVLSRRLGRSLGVDLLPMKTCSLDCAYCECGPTTNLTVERREYVPTADVLAELDHYFAHCDVGPDYVTFSGSGEPTLHSGIGTIIDHIKQAYPGQQVAVLTNSTLLYQKELRDELLKADLVVPSLDAVSDGAFSRILAPHESLKPGTVVDGIAAFRAGYQGLLTLEVFMVPGVNDTDDEIGLFRKAIERIGPDLIQLNSLDRPGAYDWVVPADESVVMTFLKAFEGFNVEVVRKPDYSRGTGGEDYPLEEKLITSLKRRPLTLGDLVFMTRAEASDIEALLKKLIEENRLEVVKGARGNFYRWCC